MRAISFSLQELHFFHVSLQKKVAFGVLRKAQEHVRQVRQSEDGLFWEKLTKGLAKEEQLALALSDLGRAKANAAALLDWAAYSRAVAVEEVRILKADRVAKWRSAQRSFVLFRERANAKLSVGRGGGKKLTGMGGYLGGGRGLVEEREFEFGGRGADSNFVWRGGAQTAQTAQASTITSAMGSCSEESSRFQNEEDLALLCAATPRPSTSSKRSEERYYSSKKKKKGQEEVHLPVEEKSIAEKKFQAEKRSTKKSADAALRLWARAEPAQTAFPDLAGIGARRECVPTRAGLEDWGLEEGGGVQLTGRRED